MDAEELYVWIDALTLAMDGYWDDSEALDFFMLWSLDLAQEYERLTA